MLLTTCPIFIAPRALEGKKRKGRADGQTRPSIDPTSQQDDDDDDDVRDVRDEVRHATIKNYFLSRLVSQQTSRDERGVSETSEDGTDGSVTRRWNAPSGFFSTARSDRTSRCPRSSDPARRRLVGSSRGNNSPRFNRRRLDVDRASPTPGPGTLWTDSLLILLRFFPRRSSVAARSTYGQGTSDAHIGTVCIRKTKGKRRIAFGFFARGRAVARRLDGGYRRRHRVGGRAADPSRW